MFDSGYSTESVSWGIRKNFHIFYVMVFSVSEVDSRPALLVSPFYTEWRRVHSRCFGCFPWWLSLSLHCCREVFILCQTQEKGSAGPTTKNKRQKQTTKKQTTKNKRQKTNRWSSPGMGGGGGRVAADMVWAERVGAGPGGDFLEQFFGYGVPVTMQRQVPAVVILEGAPDSVHRQRYGLPLFNRHVFPQCKMCSKPSQFFRCRCWTGS